VKGALDVVGTVSGLVVNVRVGVGVVAGDGAAEDDTAGVDIAGNDVGIDIEVVGTTRLNDGLAVVNFGVSGDLNSSALS
jgi:hypothetical protein